VSWLLLSHLDVLPACLPTPFGVLMENHGEACFLPSHCTAGWWMEGDDLLTSSLMLCSFCCLCIQAKVGH